MEQKLEELVQYLYQTLPQAKTITQLQKDGKAGIVIFSWNSHRFIVKPSLEVLELKATNLFITGASMLMQAALTKRDKDNKVLAAVDETLRQSEDFLVHHQTQKGLELLMAVKRTVEKIIGPSNSRIRGSQKAETPAPISAYQNA
jgi:hypothetical protein